MLFDVTDILKSKKFLKKVGHAKYELLKDVSEKDRPNATISYKVLQRYKNDFKNRITDKFFLSNRLAAK